jgi:ferrous iron transport protein B
MGAPTVSCHAVAPPRDESLGASYRTIAVVGPPNSGKTTLFNRLTKLRQKVGNFPGVTVEHHTGYVRDRDGKEVALIDLPGVYSLTPKSEDEKVAIDVLTGQMPGTPRPDAVILVLNSTNLHSHLVLAARVIALGIPTLVLLNMADELRKQGGQVDVLALARELGTPVALVSATTVKALSRCRIFYPRPPPGRSHWNFPWWAARAAIASGPCAWGPMRTIAVRRPPYGRSGLIPSSCTAPGDRSFSPWW